MKRSQGHQRGDVETRRVDLANWALRTSPKFTTGVKYQFHQGFWPDQRSGNSNHSSPPSSLYNWNIFVTCSFLHAGWPRQVWVRCGCTFPRGRVAPSPGNACNSPSYDYSSHCNHAYTLLFNFHIKFILPHNLFFSLSLACNHKAIIVFIRITAMVEG